MSFAFQTLLVSRLFKWIGVGGALFILPLVALLGYSALLVLPLLSIVRVIKIVENATDYSVQSTTRQALFLPTSREAKYEAKAVIDTFFWRAGDVLQAGLVLLGVTLGFGVSAFSAFNLVLVLFWLGLAALIFFSSIASFLPLKKRRSHNDFFQRNARQSPEEEMTQCNPKFRRPMPRESCARFG